MRFVEMRATFLLAAAFALLVFPAAWGNRVTVAGNAAVLKIDGVRAVAVLAAEKDLTALGSR